MSHHEEKRITLQRLNRRQTFLTAALVGLVAGLVAVVFKVSVDYVDESRYWIAQHVAQHSWLALLLAPLGALLGWGAVRLTQRYSPEANGSGIPHVKAVLLGIRTLNPVPLIVVKLLAGLLALAAGMSLGREGPTIHLGAACAALLGSWLQVPARTQKNLLATGAGAGLAAAFNAPLAGFLFIMEELRREMSRLTYGSALVSSVMAVAVARMMLGQQASFDLHDVAPVALRQLPVVMLVGLSAGCLGIAFNRGLMSLLHHRDRLSFSKSTWGALVGLIGMLLICFYPHLTGGGHMLTLSVLQDRVHGVGAQSILILLLLFTVKFGFTLFSYVTSVPGGIFAPLLTLGALSGYITGLLARPWLPGFTPAPEVLATVGMAALLAASVRAPLTGVVLIVEMTGQYHLLYALLLASFVAYSLAEFVNCEPIYEALLHRDLHQKQTSWHQEARVIEILVEPNSLLENMRIAHIPRFDDMLIALLDRNGEVLIPHGTTTVRAGDLLTLMVGPAMESNQLNSFLERARTL